MNARTGFFYVMSLAAVGGYLVWQGHERRQVVLDLHGADRDACRRVSGCELNPRLFE